MIILSTAAQSAFTIVFTAILIIAGMMALIVLAIVIPFFNLWMQAQISGVPIGFVELLAMRFRRVDPRKVVLCSIRAVKAGLDVGPAQIESHQLAGGDPGTTISGMIALKERNLEIDFTSAAALDLAGYDLTQIAPLAAEHGLTTDELTPRFLDSIGAPRRDTAAAEA